MSNKDTIYRQDAIDAVEESRRLNHHKDGKEACCHEYEHRHFLKILGDLPSAEPERHYCWECGWSRCHINLDKYGRSETYWYCLNWDGETDEEGFCHKWIRREDE